MFEQSVVSEGGGAKRSGVTLPVSIGLHLVAFSSAMFAAVWQVDFPKNSPSQIAELQIERAVEVPRGNPDPPKRKAAAATQQTPPKVAPADVAPTTIPQDVPKAEDLPSTGEVDPNALPSNEPSGPIGTGEGPLGDPEGVAPSGDEPTLTVGGDVKAPVIVKRVDPAYPNIAIKMRKEGVVVLQAIIDRDGNLRDVQVLRAPHPSLGEAAISAVSQWRFKPGTLNGNAVKTMFNLTVTFTLNS